MAQRKKVGGFSGKVGHRASGRVLRFEQLEIRRVLAADLGSFLTSGHVDLEISRTGSQWGFQLASQSGSTVTKYSPSDALVYAGNATTLIRPNASSYNFTGVLAGEALHVLPQQYSEAVPYVGISASGLGTAVDRYNPSLESKGRVSGSARWSKLSLVDVRHRNLDGSFGDGVFSIWQVGTFGNLNVLMSSYNDGVSNANPSGFDATDGITGDDALWTIAGGHDHYNYGFSKPGRYEVDLRTSAYFSDDGLSTPNLSGYSQSDVYTVHFSVLGIGKLGFEVANKNISEDVSTLSIDVIRTGGSDGRVSVHYASGDQTAIAGRDYTSISGSIEFLDGEVRKTIQVPILLDNESEPEETFVLNLTQANPSALNAYLRDVDGSPFGLLGDVRVVEIRILENQWNHPPDDIVLSTSDIAENASMNSAVGIFSTIDRDTGNAFTYSFAVGAGDTDNAAFSIDGNTLRANSSFDFESKSSYRVRIRSTDQGGLFVEKAFTINVADLDENRYFDGLASADSFIASYTGDGTQAAWALTRNGVSLFNGSIPNGGALVINALAGADTLQVNGRAVDDLLSFDTNRISVNNAPIVFSNTESIRLLAGLGNDRIVFVAPAASGISLSYDGGAGIDRVETPTGSNTWNITGTGIGNVNSKFSFLGTETLVGGSGDDQFILTNAGRVTGQILGGAGNDTLNLAAKTTAHTINLQSDTATSTGGIGSIESFIGGSTASVTDVFIGPNIATNWSIDGINSGSMSNAALGAVSFSNFESLTGGTAADSFVFTNAGSITKRLTGGTASGVIDSLDLSAKAEALDFRLEATLSSVPGSIDSYVGFETITGNSLAGSKVSRVNNTATAWLVNTLGHVVVSSVAYRNVRGIVGGIGADTLTGPALTGLDVSTWTLDSAGGGTLTTPEVVIAFSGMNNLTGGAGADAFVVLPSGSLSGAINGGTGTGLNSLSYARWASDVSVNLSVATVANATAIGGLTSNIQMVTGGAGNDSLRGQATKSTVLVGLAGNDTLIGGSQRDLLFGGLGIDSISGVGGDDLLVSGTTSYDTNRTALLGIYAEWISSRTFAVRTANIWGNGTGTRGNGSYFLNSNPADALTDSVFADSDSDSLTGGLNQDWFFASLGETTDFVGTGSTPDRRDG